MVTKETNVYAVSIKHLDPDIPELFHEIGLHDSMELATDKAYSFLRRFFIKEKNDFTSFVQTRQLTMFLHRKVLISKGCFAFDAYIKVRYLSSIDLKWS